MLKVGGFWFFRLKNVIRRQDEVTWSCSVRQRTKCKAYIITYKKHILRSSLIYSEREIIKRFFNRIFKKKKQSFIQQKQIKSINCFTVMEILSSRGTIMLQVAGFRFSQQKKLLGHGNLRWQCSAKTRTRCTAFIITYGKQVLKCYLDHNHERFHWDGCGLHM